MMRETLTLEQAMQLAQQNKSSFDPFAKQKSFDELVADAKNRAIESECKEIKE